MASRVSRACGHTRAIAWETFCGHTCGQSFQEPRGHIIPPVMYIVTVVPAQVQTLLNISGNRESGLTILLIRVGGRENTLTCNIGRGRREAFKKQGEEEGQRRWGELGREEGQEEEEDEEGDEEQDGKEGEEIMT